LRYAGTGLVAMKTDCDRHHSNTSGQPDVVPFDRNQPERWWNEEPQDRELR